VNDWEMPFGVACWIEMAEYQWTLLGERVLLLVCRRDWTFL
jgi:hypothetical protein